MGRAHARDLPRGQRAQGVGCQEGRCREHLVSVSCQIGGVRRADRTSLPMTWQAAAAFLACARIGAVHSAVFAGFSAESLRDRVNDCECKVLITSE